MINNDKDYVYNRFQINKDFENIDRMAVFLDEKFEIFGFKFGWDPILNLIPYLGKVFGFLTSIGLVIIMAKHKVSGKVLIKMLGNVILDMMLGSIPLIGNIGDFFFKANTRNVAILKEHYYEGKHTGSGKMILLTIAIIFLVIMIGLIYLFVKVFMWSYDKLGSIF